LASFREVIRCSAFTRLTGTLGAYSHHDGTLGVLTLVEGTASDRRCCADVCMHIAPQSGVTRSRRSARRVIEKEKEMPATVGNDPKNKASRPHRREDPEGKRRPGSPRTSGRAAVRQDDSKTVGQLWRSTD